MDITDARIARYADAHTSPPPEHLAAVEAATRRETKTPGMISGLVEARLLEALVVASGAQRVLEIGTFTGYGALSIAARLPPGGHVVTIEADAERAALARRHIEASADAARIELVQGDARTIAGARRPVRPRLHRRVKGDYGHY